MGSIKTELLAEKEQPESIEANEKGPDTTESSNPSKDPADDFIERVVKAYMPEPEKESENPSVAQTMKSGPSEPFSEITNRHRGADDDRDPARDRPSVRKALDEIREEIRRIRNQPKTDPVQENAQTVHQPVPRRLRLKGKGKDERG